ncbi:MAG: lipopolysaccharide biosynthesis protein [Planctomycetaceae bacterium]|nr:lipopolysaccharide biosynthesis protein [Planctomycetaceae bacterium]
MSDTNQNASESGSQHADANPESAGGSGGVLKHALVYGFGSMMLQVASIVLVPLYTRHLTPGDFGVLEILTRTGQIISVFLMGTGVTVATFTFYCQAKTVQQRRETAASVATLMLALLVVGGLPCVAFAPFLGGLIGVDDSSLVALGILAALCEATPLVPLVLVQARTQSAFYVTIALAMFVSKVLAVTAAVVWLGLGIRGILWASILTSASFGCVLHLVEFGRSGFRPKTALLWRTARFALPFLPGGLCFFVLANGDRYFLIRCAGRDELGVYSLGCKLAMAVGMFSFTPLFQVWSARMYGVFARPDAATMVGRACTRMLTAYVFVGLGVCVFAKEVIEALASPQYARASDVVPAIVSAYFFYYAAIFAEGAFYVSHRTSVKPWIALASMTVMCGLYLTLIPRFGATGAACALLGGFAFHAATTWFVAQRIVPVHYEYGRVATVLTSAAAVAMLSSHLDLGVATVPAKLLLGAAWPAFLWATGLVRRDEKAAIRAGVVRVLHWPASRLAAHINETDVAVPTSADDP